MNLQVSLKKIGRKLKKHSPTIISIASVGGVVVTGVIAFRAGYKSAPEIDRYKGDVASIKDHKDQFASPAEYKKALNMVRVRVVKECAKATWLPAVTGGFTIAGIISSNNMMRNRLSQAGMALSALYATFAEYRKRVAEKYGADAELEIRTGVKPKEIVETYTDKKGNEKTKVTTYIDPKEIPDSVDYILLDSSWSLWRKDNPEMTKFAIMQVEKDLNHILQNITGLISVNQIREKFDLDWVPYGQIVGWTYDPDNPECDNCIDFGLRPGTANYDNFINGKNDFVILTLNHDGIILDKIGDYNKEWRKNNFKRLHTVREG